MKLAFSIANEIETNEKKEVAIQMSNTLKGGTFILDIKVNLNETVNDTVEVDVDVEELFRTISIIRRDKNYRKYYGDLDDIVERMFAIYKGYSDLNDEQLKIQAMLDFSNYWESIKVRYEHINKSYYDWKIFFAKKCMPRFDSTITSFNRQLYDDGYGQFILNGDVFKSLDNIEGYLKGKTMNLEDLFNLIDEDEKTIQDELSMSKKKVEELEKVIKSKSALIEKISQNYEQALKKIAELENIVSISSTP